MTRRRALYIAVEGIDGAGKSTFTRALGRRLRAKGYRVRVRREPSNAELGRYAQEAGTREPWTAAAFFTLDRYLARRALEEDLGRSDIVLSDRSFWSTIAYQGSALSRAANHRLMKMQERATRAPDRVLLLDLSLSRAVNRVGGRGRSRAPFERRATLRRVAAAYRMLARRNRWTRLDARLPTRETIDRALRELSLPRRRRP